MRVLMAAPCYYPVKGGTEITVRNLSIELNRMQVHTDVMTFNMNLKWKPKWRGVTEKIDGLTVYRVPALNWLPIGHSPRVNLEINLIPGKFTHILREYDIIHFHELDQSFPLFSFLIKKPKILHLHGFYVDYYLRYHLNRFMLKHTADFFISITRQMRRDLEKIGIPQGKVAYLPNGVDTKLFIPHGVKDDDLLLFVGRIAFDKGLHVLIKSLQYLEKSVRLVIIGPPWDLKYHQQILKFIEKENKKGKHKIRYIGALNQEDIIYWYQKASVLILPSFWETFPVVILESLSCETPVIATPIYSVPEVVQNYKNGILVQKNDAIKLADAIQYLMDNKDLRERFGQNGRQLILQNFSIESIVNKLHKIYCNILSR